MKEFLSRLDCSVWLLLSSHARPPGVTHWSVPLRDKMFLFPKLFMRTGGEPEFLARRHEAHEAF